jgi:hypothetical protein
MPEALELCKRLKGKKVSDLSDDEVILLAITAGQAALAKYIQPGDRSCDKTLSTILSILDHREVVQATLSKLHKMLGRKRRVATKRVTKKRSL